jgi:dTDP-glucose 4,6-dehydratase
MASWFVTGAAGFIGSNFVRLALEEGWADSLHAFDLLTYAGNLENLEPMLGTDPRLRFTRGDVADATAVREALAASRPDVIIHFAAESHVDRSIEDPAPFVRTNVMGTQVLLAEARRAGTKTLVLVSTDEVYGALPLGTPERFVEERGLAPKSPYAASKAAADLLAIAAGHTYGQDVRITRCSNNYGPFQFPEKLIPLMVCNAMEGKPLPVYGDGLYVRDWIHVADHCRAVRAVIDRGQPGRVYNVGADNEVPNIDLVHRILALVGRDGSLIRHVQDRPGHDRRYAVDASRLRAETGWAPRVDFEAGLRETVEWYRANTAWLAKIRSGEFRTYYERMYSGR